MGSLDPLIGLAGTWKGTNKLWLSPSEEPHESQCLASVIPVLGGKFVRIDYTWKFDDQPQEGSLLVGYDTKEDLVTAVWIDSWHMSDKLMSCKGVAQKDGTIVVRGSYSAPPGPDWGWHTVIEPGNGDSFRMIMHNVLPEGKEELAVEATYARAQ